MGIVKGSGVSVRCVLSVQEVDGNEVDGVILQVESHEDLEDEIIIKVADITYSVDADDLLKAVEKASNCG